MSSKKIVKEREALIGANLDNQSQGFRGPGSGNKNQRRAGVGEKPKSFSKTWKELLIYSKKEVPFIIISLVAALTATILALIGPQKLRDITDEITKGLVTGYDLDKIVKICITLCIIYGVSWILNFAQQFIMATITQKITKRFRTDIINKTNKLPFKFFDNVSFGDILSRITNDIDTIGMSMNQSMSQLISSTAMVVGAMIMMFITDWRLALITIACTIFGLFFMAIIMKRSQKHFSRQQRHLGAINGHVEEMFSGQIVVKAYNGEKETREEFDRINRHLKDSVFKSMSLSGLMNPIMVFIGHLGYVAVCVIGAIFAVNKIITFGVIIAFTMYVRQFTQPLSQITQSFTSMQSTAAAGERVFAYLKEEELEDESNKVTNLEKVKGDVTFDHVKFGYTPERTIIHDFSAKIKAGQKVAIVGPTGAGKTTLVNLLMRFYELDGGKILIDDVPINNLTRENVHDLFCMVLQDTWLFEGSVRDNLCYSKDGVTDDDLIKACKAVGIDHFISTLPNGYDTVLDDNTALSAGQKQQLTIARAIIENAPLLILDEATSSVDTRTERIIQSAMDNLTEGRTSFVIAHRLSTIRNSDLILVMNNGDIVQSGTHDELLKAGGFYADLYNSQFDTAS